MPQVNRWDPARPYCLVLSGGGAKGVYHIGVRKALRELGVPVAAYVGNSVGAIIAAFLAQELDDALAEIVSTIGLESVVDLSPEGGANPGTALRTAAVDKAMHIARSIARNGGLDTAPLRSLLERHIDEGAIRASGVDFGLVTVNLSDLEPTEIFLDAMRPGSLVDYLMASSAFPGFALPDIGGKKHIDGGFHDNLPYEMARKRGYRRIILVDVQGAGRNRKPAIEGTETVSIRNSIAMGNVLNFDRAFLDEFTRLGRLDTLRAFGLLDGYSYFIRPDKELERRFRAGHPELATPLSGETGRTLDDLFPAPMRHDRRLLLKVLDCAAAALELPRVREYDYRDLGAAVGKRRAAEEDRIAKILSPGVEGAGAVLERLFREVVSTRTFDGTPYFYARLAGSLPEGGARRAAERLIEEICPGVHAAARSVEPVLAFLDRQATLP